VENWYKYKKEKLEPGEVERLREMNSGYGNFINNARRLGIHPNTYRYIIDRGHGTTRYINIIRAILLRDYESRTPQPAEDTATAGN